MLNIREEWHASTDAMVAMGELAHLTLWIPIYCDTTMLLT
jgi:hypothetical protein